MKRKYIFIEFMNYFDTDKNKTWTNMGNAKVKYYGEIC